ncbi:uncharacterized protein TNCV_2935131 [Trichonephila clavipes]|nr:uncharacterized protein TNCV_2935131 [Trichonephila clavipes]
MLMTSAYVYGGDQVTGQICWREAYGDYTRFDSVGSDLSEHSINISRPSTYFDGTQLRLRDFNTSCTVFAIKSPGCYLLVRQRFFTNQQCLQRYDLLKWPSRSTDISPMECVWDVLGRKLMPSRNTSE